MIKSTMMFLGLTVSMAAPAAACGTRPFGRCSQPVVRWEVPTAGQIAGMLVAVEAEHRHRRRVEIGVALCRLLTGLPASPERLFE